MPNQIGHLNQMRVLTILAFVQTGILLVLLGKLFVIDYESAVIVEPKQDEAAMQKLSASEDSSNVRSATRSPDLDYELLKEILREELAALAAERGSSADSARNSDALESVVTPESQYQRDAVLGQIEYFTSVGSISNLEMQKLQGEIAKLDNKSAKEMLNKLVSALNSGKLRGEL